VIINHFLNKYVSGEYAGYACIWVTIFFFLSGFGIAKSLNHRFPSPQDISLRSLTRYYFDRFVRLYPLLWLALLFDYLMIGKSAGVWEVMGISGKGHYWFISALIPCYLLSPLFYRLVVRFRAIYLVSFLAAFVCINYLILDSRP